MAVDQADVLVVGAGPAGSATALRLAQAGFNVTLLDRAAFPREKACSEYMSPETVRHLAALGVLDELVANDNEMLAGTSVHGPCGSRLLGEFTRAGGTPFRATGLALPRRVLDATLVRAAQRAGAALQENTTVVALLRERRAVCGVVARDAAGATREYRARVVVGADGLRSVVARRAGLHRQGRLRRTAFVAHVAHVANLSATTELHVGLDGYAGLNSLGGGLANVALVVPAARATAARGDAAAFFKAELERFPGVRGRVDLAHTVREVMVTGPFDTQSRRTTADGLLLVGDAADFFDPFTGEGIGAALRGAELAAHTLATALSTPGAVSGRALAPYRAARRRTFAGKWLVERLIGYAMLTPALFDRAIARIERRGMSHTLIGVTGSFVSPWRVLNPLFLARTVL
jgi:geranylgeranyl reductase family protein